MNLQEFRYMIPENMDPMLEQRLLTDVYAGRYSPEKAVQYAWFLDGVLKTERKNSPNA
jgi:hypothetical protein